MSVLEKFVVLFFAAIFIYLFVNKESQTNQLFKTLGEGASGLAKTLQGRG